MLVGGNHGYGGRRYIEPVIRHLALNLLKQEPTCNASIRAKRKRAGWDNDYLLAVVSQ